MCFGLWEQAVQSVQWVHCLLWRPIFNLALHEIGMRPLNKPRPAPPPTEYSTNQPTYLLLPLLFSLQRKSLSSQPCNSNRRRQLWSPIQVSLSHASGCPLLQDFVSRGGHSRSGIFVGKSLDPADHSLTLTECHHPPRPPLCSPLSLPIHS